MSPRQLSLTLACFALLTGCGGGNSDSAENSPPESDTHSALVSWDIPITRANGEELLLSEIGGYIIEYRLNSRSTYESILLEDPTANQYTIENLSEGTYDVRVAAYDTRGLYSEYSAALTGSVGTTP